jgi:MFS family permease
MTAAIRRRAERASSRNLALALLATTQFVLILDIAIVTVALPSIGTDLDFAPADLTWVINAYALMFGGFLLLGGRMADLIGRRRMFMYGLVLFTAASLAGALAQSALWLVIARGPRDWARPLVSPAALALVMTLFPEGAERNKALGIWGAVAGSGGAAGAILGGVLTDVFSWQAVLLVNIPVGIAAVALARACSPRPRARRDSFVRPGRRGLGDRGPGPADLRRGRCQQRRLGLRADARPGRPVARSDRLVRGDRVASEAPADAAAYVQQPHAALGQHRCLLTTMALFPMWFLLTLYTQDVLATRRSRQGSPSCRSRC